MAQSSVIHPDANILAQLRQFVERRKENKAYRRIEDIIQNLGCQSIIVTQGLKHSEFKSLHERFYQYTFKKYPTEVTRLDFFKNRVSTSVTGRELSQDDYIGHITLRPSRVGNIGETYLPACGLNPVGNSGNDYILTTVPCETEVLGKKLLVKNCMPFVQQDYNVGRCAQAGLWMATQYMAKKFSFKSASLSMITEFANEFLGIERPVPSGGLHTTQMASALIQLKYEPLVYNRPSAEELAKGFKWEPEHIIYRYVESGLPVILALHHSTGIGHAEVVIGHNWNFNPPQLQIPGVAAPRKSSEFIDYFLVHDDELGPYIKLPVLKDGSSLFNVRENVTCIIVALPKNVFFKGEEAELWALSFFDDPLIAKEIQKREGTCAETKAYLSDKNYGKLITRTYLTKSSEFKHSIKTSGYPEKLRNLYEKKDLPEYVWIVEISNETLYAQNKLYGEVVLDSTTGKDEYPILGGHFPGLVFLVDPNNETDPLLIEEIVDDQPRTHLIRNV